MTTAISNPFTTMTWKMSHFLMTRHSLRQPTEIHQLPHLDSRNPRRKRLQHAATVQQGISTTTNKTWCCPYTTTLKTTPVQWIQILNIYKLYHPGTIYRKSVKGILIT